MSTCNRLDLQHIRISTRPTQKSPQSLPKCDMDVLHGNTF